MRVLVVTNMYPSAGNPSSGVFVEDQVESLRKIGVEVEVFMVEGQKNRLNYATGVPQLWNHLLLNKYDLLHAHYVFSGVVARAQWRHPVVLTHHGYEVFTSWEANLCRRVTPWFDQVLVMSQEMKDRLGYPKAQVIPCGVDLERFRPLPREQARTALGLPQEKKLVLWAGDPQRREKRIDLVQAATALMREEDPLVELVLLSGKPHDDVPMYMNACDVLLLVSNAEGSPMVVKEALACNLPIVSTPVGDVPSLIGETTGCYICTQEPGDIAEKAKLVLNELKRICGRGAVKHLSLDSTARRVLGVYEEVLGRNRETRRTKP